MSKQGLVFALLALAAPCLGVLPHDPRLAWKTFSTPHFNVHVHDGLENRAPDIAAICELEYDRLARFFKFAPRSAIEVVVTDETDEANGSATPFPSNTTVLIVAPPDGLMGADELDDWMRYLICHELTHIFHLDRARGFPGFMRRIFGRFPLFFPNLFQPLWMIEGLATWSETDRDMRVGRGQSSYFRALMRLELIRGIRPLRMVNQPLARWPSGTTRYLYGVYFMNFLEARYGRDSLRRWVVHYSNDGLPWFINRNAKKAFGKNLDKLWADFTFWLHQEFDFEIKGIERAGLRGSKAATPETGAYFWGPMKGAYAVRNDGLSQARLQKLEQGAWRDIAAMNSARFSVGKKRILAVERGWIAQSRWSTDLFEIDPQSGSKRRLTKGMRIREAAEMRIGMVAVAGDAGQKRLLLLDESGLVKETLWQGSDGANVSSLSASPDGTRLLASLWKGGKGWDLVEFDFSSRIWKDIAARNEQEMNPAWSPDGTDIFFSADYGGIYNIWRLKPYSGELQQISNVLGGAFHPNPLNDQVLNFSLLTAEGYERGELKLDQLHAAPLPLERDPSPPSSPVPMVTGTLKGYSPLGTLWPTWWFPMAMASKAGIYVGFQTSTWDVLQRHQVGLGLMAGNDVFGVFQYSYLRFLPTLSFGISRMPSLEADDNYLPLRQRVSEAWNAGLKLPYNTAWRHFGIEGAASGRRAWDYWRSISATAQGETRDTLFVGRAWYDATRFFAHSIGSSGGLAASFAYSRVNPMLDNDGSWVKWQLDRPTSLGGLHILELHLGGATVSQGNYQFALAESPLASGLSNAFRPTYSLMGYPGGLPELQGKSIGTAQIGWRFPIASIERGFMAPPIGVDKVYGRLIAESGQAFNPGFEPSAIKSSLALELNAILVIGYIAGLQSSLGVAHGLDAGGGTEIYFRLGGATWSQLSRQGKAGHY